MREFINIINERLNTNTVGVAQRGDLVHSATIARNGRGIVLGRVNDEHRWTTEPDATLVMAWFRDDGRMGGIQVAEPNYVHLIKPNYAPVLAKFCGEQMAKVEGYDFTLVRNLMDKIRNYKLGDDVLPKEAKPRLQQYIDKVKGLF